MNAIDFLLKEHNHVKKVFGDITSDSHRFETKQKMFDTLAKELDVHEKMEQSVWYPCLIKENELKEIIDHLLKEEKKAGEVIKKLKTIHEENEWEKVFSSLKTDVLHHASEEQKKLFPVVKKILSESELEEIGSKMFQFKQSHL